MTYLEMLPHPFDQLNVLIFRFGESLWTCPVLWGKLHQRADDPSLPFLVAISKRFPHLVAKDDSTRNTRQLTQTIAKKIEASTEMREASLPTTNCAMHYIFNKTSTCILPAHPWRAAKDNGIRRFLADKRCPASKAHPKRDGLRRVCVDDWWTVGPNISGWFFCFQLGDPLGKASWQYHGVILLSPFLPTWGW